MSERPSKEANERRQVWLRRALGEDDFDWSLATPVEVAQAMDDLEHMRVWARQHDRTSGFLTVLNVAVGQVRAWEKHWNRLAHTPGGFAFAAIAQHRKAVMAGDVDPEDYDLALWSFLDPPLTDAGSVDLVAASAAVDCRPSTEEPTHNDH